LNEERRKDVLTFSSQNAPLDSQLSIDQPNIGIVCILRVEGWEEEESVVVLSSSEVDLVGFSEGV